jgi:hypothetical protein
VKLIFSRISQQIDAICV